MPPPSLGQAITPENSEQNLVLQLLSSPATSDTEVVVTSSDPRVAGVEGPVIIPAGSKIATITVTTGQSGEATLTLRMGTELRQLTLFVGTLPLNRTPLILAPFVGVKVNP
jgi:hypothetical protein